MPASSRERGPFESPLTFLCVASSLPCPTSTPLRPTSFLHRCDVRTLLFFELRSSWSFLKRSLHDMGPPASDISLPLTLSSSLFEAVYCPSSPSFSPFPFFSFNIPVINDPIGPDERAFPILEPKDRGLGACGGFVEKAVGCSDAREEKKMSTDDGGWRMDGGEGSRSASDACVAYLRAGW